MGGGTTGSGFPVRRPWSMPQPSGVHRRSRSKLGVAGGGMVGLSSADRRWSMRRRCGVLPMSFALLGSVLPIAGRYGLGVRPESTHQRSVGHPNQSRQSLSARPSGGLSGSGSLRVIHPVRAFSLMACRLSAVAGGGLDVRAMFILDNAAGRESRHMARLTVAWWRLSSSSRI